VRCAIIEESTRAILSATQSCGASDATTDLDTSLGALHETL